MSEYVFELDEAAASEEIKTGSFGVMDTGIYGVTINYVAKDKNNFGDAAVNINLTTKDGHNTTIWGLGIVKHDDPKKNADYNKWMQLVALSGMETGELGDFDIVKDDGTKIKTVEVFKELTEVKVCVAVQKVKYASKAGKLGENNAVYQFFREDGKSVLEVKDDSPAEKLEKLRTRLKDYEQKSYKEFMANGGTVTEDEDDLDVF